MPQAALPPLVLTACAVVAWLLLLAAAAARTGNPRITPAPPTSELGTESPAVVDLITSGWRLTGDAAAATVLDLAARGVVAVEEVGPELSLVRLRRHTDHGPLRPYEAMVYDRLRLLARDGVVATEALAEGQRDQDRWWRRFRSQVVVEARALGLSRRRWARSQVLALSAAAALPAACGAWLGWALELGDDQLHDALGAAGAVGLALLWVLGAMNGERGTPTGAAAAGRWLGVRAHLAGNRGFADAPAASVTIWGRHLAYAAVFGLAGRAVRSLPLGRPADDTRAWSDYGGMWHPVHVHYRKRWPLWGMPPGQAVARGLVAAMPSAGAAFVATLLGDAFLGWDTSPFGPALLVGLLVAAVPVGLVVSDTAGRSTVQGQIVRLRELSSDRNTPRYWLALDTGVGHDVVAYGIGQGRFADLVEGDQVRARVGRRLGWVSEVEVIQPSRYRSPASFGDESPDTPRTVADMF